MTEAAASFLCEGVLRAESKSTRKARMLAHFPSQKRFLEVQGGSCFSLLAPEGSVSLSD